MRENPKIRMHDAHKTAGANNCNAFIIIIAFSIAQIYNKNLFVKFIVLFFRFLYGFYIWKQFFIYQIVKI